MHSMLSISSEDKKTCDITNLALRNIFSCSCNDISHLKSADGQKIAWEISIGIE